MSSTKHRQKQPSKFFFLNFNLVSDTHRGSLKVLIYLCLVHQVFEATPSIYGPFQQKCQMVKKTKPNTRYSLAFPPEGSLSESLFRAALHQPPVMTYDAHFPRTCWPFQVPSVVV